MPEYGCRPLGEAARSATEQFARERRGMRTALRRRAALV
jgi:hypothetical protein